MNIEYIPVVRFLRDPSVVQEKLPNVYERTYDRAVRVVWGVAVTIIEYILLYCSSTVVLATVFLLYSTVFVSYYYGWNENDTCAVDSTGLL